MPFIPTLDVDTPPEATHLAELRGIIAHFPDGLGAFDQMYARMVGQGRLDPAMRLVIVASSARWRSDGYIAGRFYSLAMHHGLEANSLAALIEEAEGPDPTSAVAVLLAFCRKVTETAFTMVQRDIDALRAQGWTTGQIVEAVTMVSLSGYMTAMSAAGGLLNDPDLEPEPWR